uniref:TRPM SLOG domain-containing protein n=1 Tax=Plectus sambesii TaxID=2011161 RepID=A0A914XBZ0_9BILA
MCDSFTEQRPSKTADLIDHNGPAGSSENQDPIRQRVFAKSEQADTYPAVADRGHAAIAPSRTSAVPKSASKRQVRLEPTNAFGDVTFHPSHMIVRKAAKYVRLSDKSNMDDVVELMTKHWDLVKPEIKPGVILSVVGGGEHFRLSDSRKNAIFDQGLIKVIEMTNGWILSLGMNSGVSKAIGDAVREGQSFQFDHNGEIIRTIHCIGIAPWNIIKGREVLIASDPEETKTTAARYQVDPVPGHYSLNPDHSHFLFIDDGDAHEEDNMDKYQAALDANSNGEFHAKLEARLRTDYPVICLLIDGGYKSFVRIRESLKKGTHVIICKGTGRMANVLAEAVTFFKTKSDSSGEKDFRKQLESLIEENNFVEKGFVKNVADEIKTVATKYNSLLTVFDVDKDALDLTIMEFLLDLESENAIDRIKLALRWNASADAASKMFAHSTFDDINREDKTKLFTEALANDQIEFVKLFTDYSAKEKLLTVEQLRNLYIKTLNQNRQDALYMQLVLMDMKLWVDNGNIYLHHIHTIIKKFTRLYDDPQYSNDKSDQIATESTYFDHPFRELFIWAVLFNRKQLALFFWENCDDPLSVALLGCLLCIGMKRKTKKVYEPVAEEFQDLKRVLQRLATGIVDRAYAVDRENAMLIAQLPIKTIGNLNSMDVASIARAQTYFNSNCCQQVISKQWKRGFDGSTLLIVLSTWLFPLFFWWIRFDKNYKLLGTPRTTNSNQVVGNATNSMGTATAASGIADSENWKKCRTFYASPVVRFTLHMTAFLFYMTLYASVMLFYYPTTEEYWRVHWQEIVLYFWQATFICEMYRKIKKTPGDRLSTRFQDWWRNGALGTWNLLDFISVIISVIALILRCFSSTFPLARLLMLVAMLLYFQQVCKIFLLSSYLGPKVIMIKKMVADLGMFLLMLMVFFLSYAISVQSLMYPHRPLYWGIGWDLFQQGWWKMFGDLNEEATQGHVENCTEAQLTFPPEGSWDCFLRVYPIPLFLVVYLFFGSILLINMLIAAFAHIFENVQANSQEIWRYQMYFLLNEFDDKPLLPPPFIFISHARQVMKHFCGKPEDSKEIKINGQRVTENQLKYLKMLENDSRRNFAKNQGLEDTSKTDED